jgi:hypothetical protein
MAQLQTAHRNTFHRALDRTYSVSRQT